MPIAAGNPYPKVGHFVNASAADILHVTCHGGIKTTKGEIVWTLNHRNRSLETDIDLIVRETTVLRSQPLVFGNACASSLAFGATNGDRRG